MPASSGLVKGIERYVSSISTMQVGMSGCTRGNSPEGALTVVFLVSNLASHLYSTAGLARRLRSLRCNVEYWGDPVLRRSAVAQDFSFHEVGPLWSSYERILLDGWAASLRNPGAAWRRLKANRKRRVLLRAAIAELERALSERLSKGVPDLILVDPLLAAYVPLLEARGLRCVLLQDKPWPGRDRLVPPPTSVWCPGNTAAGRLFVWWLWEKERLLQYLRACGNALLGCLGFYTYPQLLPAVLRHTFPGATDIRGDRRVQYDLYLRGVPEWILGSAETDLPRAAAVPSHVRYVGSWPDMQRRELGAKSASEGTKSRLVYVAMGISMPSWRDDVALIRRIVAALRDVPHLTVAVSTGNLRAFAELRDLASEVHIAPLLPQIALLRKADLAIVHGGANSYRECIASHTPMLVFPRNYDQFGVAARVVKGRLGLRANRRWTSSAAIRRKILHILKNSEFASRVRELNEMTERSADVLLKSAMRQVFGEKADALWAAADVEPDGRLSSRTG